MRAALTRRAGAAIAAILLIALAVPATAYAAVLAATSASQRFTVLSWKAVAAGAGGSATTGSYQLTFLKSNNNTSRQGVFDIVNSGTSALTGVTLTSSSSAGIGSNTTVTYALCSVAWRANVSGNQTTYSCSGSTTTLGTSPKGGNGSITGSRSIAAGARLYVRASTTASGNNTTASQTISIKVARSQAAAKRSR